MIPNRCYTCGKSGTHTPGCPAKRGTTPLIEGAPFYDIPTFQGPTPPIINAETTKKISENAAQQRMSGHKTIGNAVLPLVGSHQPGHTFMTISTQPYVDMRLLRFWVDEACAPFFRIEDIRVKNIALLLGAGGVPATHFSMAHHEDYEFATEFNEHLGPANRVSVVVTNTSDVPRVFSSLFEALTIDAASPRPCPHGCGLHFGHLPHESCTG
jgi:hypothetical protein